MKSYRTIRVMYGKGLKNRVANIMHKRNLIKVIWQVPILDDAGDEIGCVCTFEGNSKALWILSKLFEKEVGVQLFTLNGEKHFEAV